MTDVSLSRGWLPVLLLAALAQAQDLEEIAGVMAERERVTYPFAVSYWVEVQSEQEGQPGARYPARAAWSVDRLLWRGAVAGEEHCWARIGNTWWFVERDPRDRLWHGEIAATPEFTWRLVPVDFGLEHASQPLSKFLLRPSARIRGRERVGDFDCIVVVMDWVHSETEHIQHPLALWLAVEHDFYPVQVVRYTAEAYPDTRDEDRLTIDGKVYKPATWRVVDELTTVGRACFPVRGRQLARSRFERGMRMTLDLATLRVGREVEDDAFALPGWMYVVDRRSSAPYFFTPVGRIPLSLLAISIYVVVALAVVLEARRRWRRRRRRRKAEGTVWDDA